MDKLYLCGEEGRIKLTDDMKNTLILFGQGKTSAALPILSLKLLEVVNSDTASSVTTVLGVNLCGFGGE